MSRGRILFIDAYDSFSNNITNLLRDQLGVSVEKIRIDDPRFVLNDDAFLQFLKAFDAVVAGPGPGHPQVLDDVGLIAKIWSLPQTAILPALGICLGFQSLCLANGATIGRLVEPRHGLVTEVSHKSTSIFKTAKDVHATQYHSLCVKIESGDPVQVWKASTSCPNLLPTAWDLSDAVNGPILMAVQHNHKPFVGVQFHPESICTNQEGKTIIRAWWQQACEWLKAQNRTLHDHQVFCTSLRQPSCNSISQHEKILQHIEVELPQGYSTLDIVDKLKHCGNTDPILLQSGVRNGRPLNPETGRYSIIGLPDHSSQHIRYCCNSSQLIVTMNETVVMRKAATIHEAFDFLEEFIQKRQVREGVANIPFWGGLIGYTSYEAGLASIGVSPDSTSPSHPDMWYVFVERSIVLDHATCTAYVQTTRSHDKVWQQHIAKLLCSNTPSDTLNKLSTPSILSQPDETQYRAQVKDCQAQLRAGESYELCLTDQTTVQSDEDSWKLYKRLSCRNPAPFGVYLRLEDSCDSETGVSVVGSSPERFLSWSRHGLCQFRPIKGTVSKASGTTRTQAETILRTRKETAENLMIVDLIRHDLAGVEGVRDVRVPSLMAVEEYETVFQLVSVIEGDLTPPSSGVSVLAASLPPGSMTGAPKRRSCELLQGIESHQPRGLYSGVIGYLDVGGGGDFSVVIRTAFKWNDEELWRIGAGGAVTVLSTPEGEYEEMLIKRERLLDVLLDRNDA